MRENSYEALQEEILQLKKTDAALRESEEHYRNLFDSIDEGFCIIEMIFDERDNPVDYRFLQVNSSFEKQTGLKDAQGQRMLDMAPQHEKHWFELYGKIALTGKPFRFENRAEQLGRWFDVYAFRFGKPENHQVAILFNDITGRKKAEEALLRAHDELENRIKERTQDIQEKSEELALSNKELEQFALLASHDLQEPLRKIVSFTQLLAGALEGQVEGKTKEYLDYIVDGAKRMHAVIRDLLIYSRVGHKELELQTFDVTEAVKEAASNLELVISETKAEIIYHPLPSLKAHRSFIIQIFYNLISNSLKYRSGKTPRIEISAQQKAEFWEFAVVDNGIGIDFKFTDKLFVIFQKLHAKNKYEGTGIGLAVCKRMVERHGGKIWAEAHEDGAVLKFTLPNHKSVIPTEFKKP